MSFSAFEAQLMENKAQAEMGWFSFLSCESIFLKCRSSREKESHAPHLFLAKDSHNKRRKSKVC
jgi:hypothetical protein